MVLKYTKAIASIVSIAAFWTQLSSAQAQNCHSDMSFLSARLPQTANPEIRDIINKMLSTDISTVMKSATSQGFSPEDAVKATMQQARVYDESARQAVSTASQTDALGNSDDEFLASIKSGKLNLDKCDGIRNSALCSAAISKIGAVFNRAIAAEMTCHIRAKTWAQ